MTIEMTISLPARDAQLIAPTGLSSPAATCTGCEVSGADVTRHIAPTCGQVVLDMRPTADTITLRYSFTAASHPLPDAIFAPRDSRFIRPAPALAAEAQAIVAARGLQGYVDHVAQIFDYGHVDAPFYAETDEMPQVCDVATGSCVDINAYLISGLRAAGIEAGYLTGYFIPQERRDHTTDMHCWVVTRTDGAVQHWDIAHYLKMGRRDVAPALNPKPGVRVAMAHSMGWTLPALGLHDAKLLAEPVWWQDGTWQRSDATFALSGYDPLDTAQNAAALVQA